MHISRMCLELCLRSLRIRVHRKHYTYLIFSMYQSRSVWINSDSVQWLRLSDRYLDQNRSPLLHVPPVNFVYNFDSSYTQPVFSYMTHHPCPEVSFYVPTTFSDTAWNTRVTFRRTMCLIHLVCADLDTCWLWSYWLFF